ncbi:type 1 pili tip component [Agaribacterium haliotis]|uniref:type 1 pili tip component n=1 Tax=Agaribacterium haliotis TaxID=2013869 RepID=UPI000BB56E8E|nr:type 1 pili tip component [Agaribacterium haliotis]
MTIKELAGLWQDHAKGELTEENYSVKLTLEDAAKIAALSDMYPLRTQEQLISELLSAALAELERSFPYIAGKEVAMLDEFGDPIYKDTGPTPAFQALTRKHLNHYREAANT